MRYVDELNHTIYEKGWFMHYASFRGRWIPVAIEYKDSKTAYMSGSMTVWEDPVERVNKKFRLSFPTKLIPGINRNCIKVKQLKERQAVC